MPATEPTLAIGAKRNWANADDDRFIRALKLLQAGSVEISKKRVVSMWSNMDTQMEIAVLEADEFNAYMKKASA